VGLIGEGVKQLLYQMHREVRRAAADGAEAMAFAKVA
jgi:hypothetical protein